MFRPGFLSIIRSLVLYTQQWVYVIQVLLTDVCVTVHHIWKWREVPTWCNNYDLLP